MEDFTDRLWMALKEEGCIHPKTAVRIVLLNENTYRKAVISFINMEIKNNT